MFVNCFLLFFLVKKRKKEWKFKLFYANDFNISIHLTSFLINLPQISKNKRF